MNYKLKKIVFAMLSIVLSFSVFLTPNPAQASYAPGNYIITFAPGVQLPKALTPYATQLFPDTQSDQFANTYRVTVEDGDLLIPYRGMFSQIELDREIHTAEIYLNDPGFTGSATNTDRQWGLAKANFLKAWDKTTGSDRSIVAVIDTGVDVTHADLQTIIFTSGYDFIDKKSWNPSDATDPNGHGTLVTGVIGATPNNGTGIAGGAWQVSVMPVRALDAQGKGYVSSVAQAIVWAADHKANIINLSLGGTGFSEDKLLTDSITYAFNAGAIIIAAAGNDSQNSGLNLDNEIAYPICSDSGSNMIIGVTAVDVNDQKPAFANYGKNCVDVSAPGKRILSTINHDPVTGANAPNGYAFASGTSLAVPFVSAEAVLIRSLNPGVTNRQVRDIILKTTDAVDAQNPTQCGGSQCLGLIGTGRINAYRAVTESVIAKLKDGEYVQVFGTESYYFINGGKKQPISSFVRAQRFSDQIVITVTDTDLDSIPLGTYTLPKDGTLVKAATSNTVYMIGKGGKLPVSYQVFLDRKLRFENVATVSDVEINSWLTGNFLTPREGVLVRGVKGPTVYWSVGGELHPISYEFFVSRGLNVFPLMLMSDTDLASYPIGQAFFF